ncbi:MAG TPA: UvrD-helicase domain-containing protein [Solirubrobacteraceae bacterium]|jgi:ATP-dependent exoDNAse (exonuclease V) beta subunit
MSTQLEIFLPEPEPEPGNAERTLTDEQQQAVARREGSLLLSAGAGSGKTSVLVERFVRAVLEDGVAPARILAITFTERSAGELAERIRTRFLELHQRELARDTEAAFLGTFHGFCARLLRAHSLLAGLDPDFTILDEAHAGRLRLDAFRAALADFLDHHGGAAIDLVAAFTADRLRAMVLDVYAQLRSQGQAQPTLPRVEDAAEARQGEDVAEGCQGEDAERADREGASAAALLDTLLQGVSRRYADAKRHRGGLDFDDLELCASALLRERSDVRSAWSQRFQLLMVDEFQDTNPRQLAILAALQRENLFTVGDEFQSIYGFRHADVGLFRARRAELAAQGASLALTYNFRSHPQLLAAVNAVFAKRFGEDHMPLLPGRPADGEASIELLLTDQRAWNGGSEAIDIAGQLPPAPRWRQAEARLLAQRVADIVAAGEAAPGDVAVLLRALGDLPLYQRALEERGLRTLASVGSFWGHQQVGDLLAYLRALANPLDEVALYSMLASPLVGLSSDALAHLSLVARDAQCEVWETLSRAFTEPQLGADPQQSPADLRLRLDPEECWRVARFIDFFAAERTRASQHPIAELLRRALDFTGYQQHLLSLPWGSRRLANVHKLLRLAHRFEAQQGRDLRGFLDHVDHQLDVLDRAEPEAPVSDGQDAVRFMTIHAAKGLEFPVVCLADLGRKPGVNRSDLLVDGSRIGLRLAQLDGSPGVPTLDYQELLDERRLAEAFEEQRIVYVGLTRARQRLLLSGGIDFGSWPADVPGAAPLAWLAPALVPELPALVRQPEQPAVSELDLHGAPGVHLRCFLNTPAALGVVLRQESLSESDASKTSAPALPPSPESDCDARPTQDHGLGPHPPSSNQPEKAPQESEIAPREPEIALREPEIALSYTALSELERCGYRYYLQRVLHLPDEHSGGHGVDGRLRGRIVHRLLQQFDFASPRLDEQDVARVARELGASLSGEQQRELAASIVALGDTELAHRLAAAPRLHREHPFAFSLPPLVSGVFDLLAPSASGDCLVVDYKSDRMADEEDLPALVERDYSAQRLVYALAALHHGAPRVEVVHWFLARPHDWVTAVFKAEDRAGLQEELRTRAARARQRGFAVSPAPHRNLCFTCPARATLCSWDATATSREHPPSLP